MVAFVVVASLSAMSVIAAAQTRKPGPSAPAKRPARPASGASKQAAADAEDGGALASKEERPPSTGASKDAGTGAGAVEAKTLDGGTRVFRFGEIEIEGRLKSPQIVYFLRRVRAEFAAGDLGHRSFVRELEETRNEPGF
jgi:hypothetical protein